MAQKKAYSRYFIILQQDENGYSLASDKLPSGYTKLETKNDKCKISYYVQNLKKEMEPYYMMLICNKKDVKKLIKLGTMNIDDYGRAEVTYEYSVDNVAGSNTPVDMITGAAVIKFVGTDMVSVMSGFSTTEVPTDWRSYDLFEEKKEEYRKEIEVNVQKAPEHTENKKEVERESKEEKNIFDEYEQRIEEIKGKSSQQKSAEEIEELRNQKKPEDEKVKEEKPTAEELTGENKEAEVSEEHRGKHKSKKGEDSKHKDHKHDDSKHKDEKCEDNKHEDNKDIDEKCEENNHEANKYEDNKHEPDYPSGTVGDFFKALAEDFEEMKDACKEIKKCRWYKVPVNNLDEICDQKNYNKYTMVYYPMISYYPYIKKYGHYLMGYKYDASGRMKYLVYGVPGKKARIEQPYGGKSGFVTWVPEKLGEERDDDMGYWLMFYDFRTSTIVIPMK